MDDQGTDRTGSEGLTPSYGATFFRIAIGIVSAIAGYSEFASRESVFVVGFRPLPIWAAAYWLVAGAMIGWGLLTPIRRELLGAVVGFLIAAAWTFCAFVATHWDLWMSA